MSERRKALRRRKLFGLVLLHWQRCSCLCVKDNHPGGGACKSCANCKRYDPAPRRTW